MMVSQSRQPKEQPAPIKVIHLITELSIGGAQMVLLRLLANLDRTRYQVMVACLYNRDGAVAQQIRALGIPVIDLGMTRKWRVDAFLRLWRLLRQTRPAVLHTWMFHCNIPGRILGRLAGVPVIISAEHTMGQESGMRVRLNRLTGGLADRVLCVSPQVADYARTAIHLPSSKVVVVPNGIDLKLFANLPSQAQARAKFHLPPQAFIIGAIGRPRAVKGYRFLIEAMAQLTKQAPGQFHLLFVGNGPERPALLELAQQLQLTESITFLDDQNDIPGLLPALDVLASASLWEGMPMVILEAMAAGLPVVATNVGGTPDVVVAGETGLLVPPADPAALAAALERVAADGAGRQRMGTAGRQRVEQHFSVTRNVELTQALYEQLLQEKS
ncbi:MAG: glycosyltransferase [Caldilineaceae bacterium]